MSTHSFHIEKSIKYIAIPLYTLAAICFMIYTTEQAYTFADTSTEDLGYDITSANASVTVGTACTLTSTITSPHTATIANGINSTDIGTTVLNTKCNDTGGYALYAIGYTGDEYGATDLTYTSLDGTTTNSNYNIATGTATSGNTSNWSMKLSPVAGTTTATIDNNYDNYNIVPDDYTKVATLNTVTDSANTSTATGSSVSTTYQAYISPTQPAGTYTGKVKYTLVHPSIAPKPEIPVTIDDLTYMQDIAGLSSWQKGTLLASMPEGQQYILKDSRDQKEYYISKLADGNIWMTQNLDLDIEASRTYTSADTDLPEGQEWAPNISTYVEGETWYSSDVREQSFDPGDLYWNGLFDTNDYHSLSDVTVSEPSESPGGHHYHIGNYYNWTAAIAMNRSSSYYTQYADANQSICPAGWRLPTLIGDGSFEKLVSMQELSSGQNGNIQKTPTYFIYGGACGDNGTWGSLGSRGFYWSSTVYNDRYAYMMEFNVKNGFIGPQDTKYRRTITSVRCAAR